LKESLTPYLYFSFLSEFQLIMDAIVLVELTKEGDVNTTKTEVLTPTRHSITLPLNNLNNYFSEISTSFNYHNRLEADR